MLKKEFYIFSHAFATHLQILFLVKYYSSNIKIMKTKFLVSAMLHSEKIFYLLCSTFKNNEKCFLFHLKSNFRSHDTQIFVLTFWSFKNIRLISKFMTSKHG